MPVGFDGTNFLNGVVVIYPIKKILNSTYYRPSKYIIRIDIDDIIIPRDRKLII